MEQNNYWETPHYRCLNEIHPRLNERLYLTICGIENCTPDKPPVARKRDGYHLHVVLSGSGEVIVGHTRYTLHSGQMFVVKPDDLVSYQQDPKKPWSYCWMSYDGVDAAQYTRDAGFTDGVNVLNCHVDTGLFYNCCERALARPQLALSSALIRLGSLHMFLGAAIESNEIGNQKSKRALNVPVYNRETYVGHAVDYINDNYRNISVSDIAGYLGIDRTYFAVLFKQSRGMSARDYLMSVRMTHAGRMLINSGLTVQEVARNVGYENALTFSKTFKRFYGVSPKYYREMPGDRRPTAASVMDKLKDDQE